VGFPFTAEQLDNAGKGEGRGFVLTCPEAPVFAPRGVPRCGGNGGGGGGAGGAGGEGRSEGGRRCARVRAEGVHDCIKEVCWGYGVLGVRHDAGLFTVVWPRAEGHRRLWQAPVAETVPLGGYCQAQHSRACVCASGWCR
jgi:hypothetical protein